MIAETAVWRPAIARSPRLKKNLTGIENAYRALLSNAALFRQCILESTPKELKSFSSLFREPELYSALSKNREVVENLINLGKFTALKTLLIILSPASRFSIFSGKIKEFYPLNLAIQFKNREMILALFSLFSESDLLKLLMLDSAFGVEVLLSSSNFPLLLDKLSSKNLATVLTWKGKSHGPGNLFVKGLLSRYRDLILRKLDAEDLTALLSTEADDGSFSLIKIVSLGKFDLKIIASLSPEQLVRAAKATRLLPKILELENFDLLSQLLDQLPTSTHEELLLQKNPDGSSAVCSLQSPRLFDHFKAIFDRLSIESQEKMLLSVNKTGSTLLSLFIYINHLRAIEFIFKKPFSQEAFVRLLTRWNKNGDTIITVAASRINRDSLPLLLGPLTPETTKKVLQHVGPGLINALDNCLYFPEEGTLQLLLSKGAKPSGAAGSPFTHTQLEHIQTLRLGVGIKGTRLMFASYFSLAPIFAKHCHEERFEKEVQAFSDAFKDRCLSAEALAEKVLRGHSTVIPFSWSGHFTAVVLTKDLFMKCNRGDGTGHWVGVSAFQLASPPSKETLCAAIKQLRTFFLSRAEGIHFFYHTINSLLRLTPLSLSPEETAFLRQKPQKYSNCANASPKSAIRALLFLNDREAKRGSLESYLRYKAITREDRSQARSISARLRSAP